MDIILYHHSWALVTLVLISATIINSIRSILYHKKYSVYAHKLALYSLMSVHIQALLGVITYMISPITKAAMNNFGMAMKVSAIRFFAVEHPTMVILGVIAITIGFIKTKKINDDKAKYKKILIFYSIGIALILSQIPINYWSL